MAAVGMGWRALGVAAMAAGTLSANGCGAVGCVDSVTVVAPQEVDDPSAGSVTVRHGDEGQRLEFAPGAREIVLERGGYEGEGVDAVLVMPDGSEFVGFATKAEHRTWARGACLRATIELGSSAQPG